MDISVLEGELESAVARLNSQQKALESTTKALAIAREMNLGVAFVQLVVKEKRQRLAMDVTGKLVAELKAAISKPRKA